MADTTVLLDVLDALAGSTDGELHAHVALPTGSKRAPHLVGRRTHNASTEGRHTMSDHKVEDLKGRLKQAAGDVTGDEGLKREGKLDQASAATKSAIDDVAEKAKSVINPKK